jgi:hypothetical protein
VQDLTKVVEHLWNQWRPGQPLPPVADGQKAKDPLAAEVASLLAEASRQTTRDPIQLAALRKRLDRVEQYGFAKTAAARGVTLKKLARPVFTVRTRGLTAPKER